MEFNCDCTDNKCPNTCEHKQDLAKNDVCYFQWTCDCECNCPNKMEISCEICCGSMCKECLEKIVINNKELYICKYTCLKSTEEMDCIIEYYNQL